MAATSSRLPTMGRQAGISSQPPDRLSKWRTQSSATVNVLELAAHCRGARGGVSLGQVACDLVIVPSVELSTFGKHN